MKKYISCFTLGLLITGFFASCSKNVNPIEQLSTEQIADFKYQVSRYICRLPKYASENTKFMQQFDEAYKEYSTTTNLDKYYKGDSDTVYFEISKIAPSIKKKYTATGGKLVMNSDKEIIYYQEVYRTWKMETELLKERTQIFFNDMIINKDLSPYYTENINADTYIEFPNKNCKFDINTRKWVLTQDLAYVR